MDRHTILVIEDNPMSRKLLRLTLEAEDYHIVEAADGRSAITYLEREAPDLVIQDLVLPDIDGLELTRRIRAMDNGKSVPIVIVSGFVGHLEEVRALREQYVEILVKPVTPSKLVATVQAHLSPVSATERPANHGKRVLLVDDSPSQLKLDVLRFVDARFHVTPAVSAEDALVVLGHCNPDVVVTDVLMPGMDGFELCSLIRRNAATAHIPVVLISAHQEEGDIRHAKQVGASGFLPRGPNSLDVIDAAFEAIASGVPAVPNDALRVGRGEHAQRLIQRLERYVTVQSSLEQRCAVQSAELAMLGGVADALARSADADATLRDLFAATLDAAGISSGALFLNGEDGRLSHRQSIGYDLADGVASFFGALELLANVVERKLPVIFPSPDVPMSRAVLATARIASMQIVPLVLDGKGVGAIVLSSRANDLPSEGVIGFARAMGAQIVQALALMKAFEERRAVEGALHRANEDLKQIAVEREVAQEALHRANADLERRVEERTLELQRSAQRLRDMVAFISHDLRNPLSTICLGTEQLRTGFPVADTSPIAARIIERIGRASGQMQTLIDGLVDFAGIEDGSFTVERRVISVRALVSDALELNAPIRPEHLEHVFDRYWHLPGTGRRGTGLGLAIAKGIVEAHGGQISVASVVDEGSSFRFTLLLSADPEEQPVPVPVVSRSMRARRILVVDDDPFLRLSIADLLEDAGYIVSEASDGAVALGMLATQTADLILLDQQMPIMNGDEFLRARALDQALSQIPVVMLSATTTILLKGVGALVRKPFTVTGLLDAVNLHCLRKQDGASEPLRVGD